MSRSIKKNPVRKDRDRTKVNWYNRIFRRVNKQLINSNKEPKSMKGLINPYDVCGWKFWDFENKHKYYRK